MKTYGISLQICLIPLRDFFFCIPDQLLLKTLTVQFHIYVNVDYCLSSIVKLSHIGHIYKLYVHYNQFKEYFAFFLH